MTETALLVTEMEMETVMEAGNQLLRQSEHCVEEFKDI